MVLVDHTESGFASELVAFLAPHLNGAPPADDLVTKGEAAKLNSLAEKLGDGAASDTALRALVGALCKHTADLPAEDMLAAYTLMWDVINANTPDEKSTLALELVTSMVRDLVAKPADRPEARLSVYAPPTRPPRTHASSARSRSRMAGPGRSARAGSVCARLTPAHTASVLRVPCVSSSRVLSRRVLVRAGS
jgi:hypothetical protein